MCRNKAQSVIPNVYCFLLMYSYKYDFKHFLKNWSITYLVLFFVLQYFLSPFFCCDFIICMLVLLVSFSHILFFFLLFCHWHFSVLLAFRGAFGLSELHGILGVGSGSTSSCTTPQKILLWVLPGMFFAWKCFADVLEPCLWCSLNYPTCVSAHRLRMPHITLLWHKLSASPFCSPPPCVFGTFSW